MTRNNYKRGVGGQTIGEAVKRLTTDGVSALSNAEFARHNQQFIDKCKKLKIEPTARQASKFRNKKGVVYNA